MADGDREPAPAPSPDPGGAGRPYGKVKPRWASRVATIAGVLLGLLFVASGIAVLFGLAPQPEIPEDTPMGHFFAAFGPTGYFTFIKVLEVLGGVLVAVPRTRNVGLLVLGPIIVNILAFHVFITRGAGLFSPLLIVICLLAAYLLWAGRGAWASLLRPSAPR